MNIANILKALRIESGLTQEELGVQLKMSQSTITNYENGQRAPHILSLIAYADYFGCPIDFLVGRTDEYGNKLYTEQSRNIIEILTADEREFVDKYRALSNEQKLLLSGYIDGLTNK